MRKISFYLMQSLFIVFSVVGISYAKCPEFEEGKSFVTQNSAGNSTYSAKAFYNEFMPKLLETYNNLPKGDVLDVGAGYGEFSSYFLNHYDGKIIYNEISDENTYCFEKKGNPYSFTSRLKVLSGDITKENVQEKIPNKSLKMIYAKHVMHFFNAKQTESFINMTKQKLKNNGLIVLFFENPVLDDQKDLAEKIQGKFKYYSVKTKKVGMEIIKKQFAQKSLYKFNENCSFSEWSSVADKYKSVTFPCVLDRKTLSIFGGVKYYQLINPEELTYIFENNGFEHINWQKLNENSFLFVAQNKASLS